MSKDTLRIGRTLLLSLLLLNLVLSGYIARDDGDSDAYYGSGGSDGSYGSYGDYGYTKPKEPCC